MSWFILDIMINNAFILEKKIHPEQQRRRSSLSFRQDLGQQLIGGYAGQKAREKRFAKSVAMPEDLRKENMGSHFLHKIDGRKKECIK